MNKNDIKDGFCIIDEKCTCGGSLRLHAQTFDRCNQRYYVDCSVCGDVSVWRDTPEDAIKAFREGVVPEYTVGNQTTDEDQD